VSHPADDMRGTGGDSLSDKTIILGVTGSIAAVECVKLARELTRRGARVVPVMTLAAQRIIHPDALHFACGEPVITELTGEVEHVRWCGDRPGRADLLLVCPATANTIGKMAYGIDDTPVTTFATTALGSGIPVVVVPAMHGSMYRHPAVQKNLQLLAKWGVDIVPSPISEGKAKLASIEYVVLYAERALSGKPLQGKRVLITSGPTREPVDPIRILTNRSSGSTGRELARALFVLGAEVTVISAAGTGLTFARDVRAERTADFLDAVLGELSSRDYDAYISAAAIGDYEALPEDEKIRSGQKKLVLELRPTPKVIDEVRSKYPDLFIMGFKAETSGGDNGLRAAAGSLLERGVADVVVANDVAANPMGGPRNRVLMTDGERDEWYEGDKAAVARRIAGWAASQLK